MSKRLRRQLLPEDERHSLTAWLNELEHDDDWDRQVAKDFSPGGRGHHLAEQVKRDIAAGKARPIEEGFDRYGESERRDEQRTIPAGNVSSVRNRRRDRRRLTGLAE